MSNVPATKKQSQVIPAQQPGALKIPWNEQEKSIMRQSVADGLSEPEFNAFLAASAYMGLNPLLREIYMVKYGGRPVLQVGIDGHVKKAEETQKYRGFTPARLTVRDKRDTSGKLISVVHEFYDPENHELISATIGVIHADDEKPMEVTSQFKGYVQLKDGKPIGQWKDNPTGQLIKCAQALAIRRRFKVLPGVVAPEEMEHAKREIDAINVEVMQVPSDPIATPETSDSIEQEVLEERRELIKSKGLGVLKAKHKALQEDDEKLKLAINLAQNHFGLESLVEHDDPDTVIEYLRSKEFENELRAENLLPQKRR